MDRLGGITPKTLTQRLRELGEGGIVEADREPGRREVWYRLTSTGAELGPAVEALSWWGWRHAWRPPYPGEALHVEHLLRAITQVIERTGDERRSVRWHLRFRGEGDYLIESDGNRWSLASTAPNEPPDVTVTASTAAWAHFVADPSLDRASELGIEIVGSAPARRRFVRLLSTFPAAAGQQGGGDDAG